MQAENRGTTILYNPQQCRPYSVLTFAISGKDGIKMIFCIFALMNT